MPYIALQNDSGAGSSSNKDAYVCVSHTDYIDLYDSLKAVRLVPLK